MANIAEFFHVYELGKWREPLVEFLSASKGLIRLGIVGSTDRVVETITQPYIVVANTNVGTEFLTLNALWEWAQDAPEEIVLYAHTKGASSLAPHQAKWRQAMLKWIYNPEHVADLLSGKCDLVGSRAWDDRFLNSGDFDGGYWIGRTKAIASTPPPPIDWPYFNTWHTWPLQAGMLFKDTDGTIYRASSESKVFFEIGEPIN